MQPNTDAKPGKNQFKCFHCRKIYDRKDGNWFNWKEMQVHLCKICDKKTAGTPERAADTH